jgi:hypothetical protein
VVEGVAVAVAVVVMEDSGFDEDVLAFASLV